jgi:hypothetical protein
MKTTTKQHQFAGTRHEWVVATVVALLAWMTTSAPAQNPYGETRGADMPIATADATCSPVVNGNIYLFGGRQPNYESLIDTIQVYNVASDTWDVADGTMPYAYCGGGSNYTAAWGGKVYISPGLGPTDNGGWGQHNRIIEFDPATETAVERAAFPGTTTIWRLNLVAVGEFIYCFGASGNGHEYKIWRYDPTADVITWVGSTVALMDSTAILGCDEQVYLFSWRGGPIEVYDPASNTCEQTESAWDTNWGGPMPWRGPGSLIYILNPMYSPLRCYDSFEDDLSNLGFTYSFDDVWAGMCHMWDDTTGKVYFFGGYSYPPYTLLAGTYILVPSQEDTTPPTISSITASPSVLWPPNHKMVPVTVPVAASDDVGVVSCRIISVTSSEPDHGLGDGDTAGDIQITGDLKLLLRAERSGKGNGRTYTITVECRDAADNAATRTTTVTVPRDQGKK